MRKTSSPTAMTDRVLPPHTGPYGCKLNVFVSFCLLGTSKLVYISIPLTSRDTTCPVLTDECKGSDCWTRAFTAGVRSF